MKLIGAGFGRTGTLSLKLALDRLGLRPYHMREVSENRQRIHEWRAIAANPEAADWGAVFAGYDATLTWPAAAYWRELADHFPEAKVLLSVRDPERWYASLEATILKRQRATGSRRYRVLGALSPEFAAFYQMTTMTFNDRVFGGEITDKAHVIEVFNDHIETVQATIPGERLLTYDVTQGWEPLCDFLGLDVPDGPFPHCNESESFGRYAKDLTVRMLLRRV